MRRLTLLFAGGAVWLFLAAIPVFADGGPHIASINSGAGGINADSCAGCHRAHTAQGAFLLTKAEGEAFCFTCHGSAGIGATTNVEDGVQYTPTGVTGTGRGAELGALRNGGFDNARIASGSVARQTYIRSLTPLAYSQKAKVPALLTGQSTTSTHGGTGTAWGNGAGPGGGATVTIECTTCHNPHGNGLYRILNPIPINSTAGGFSVTTGISVTDATTGVPAGDARNYTIIQLFPSTSSLLASQVSGFGASAGDYFHRRVPWNVTTNGANGNDAPNGRPTDFNFQINAWCATCHTRLATTDANGKDLVPYSGPAPLAPGFNNASWNNSTGTTYPFTFRHPTSSNKPCTTCHVAHGTNATMSPAVASENLVYGDGSFGNMSSSFLLKVNNRGTCQSCHDPTNTFTDGQWAGPTPAPIVP